MKELLHWTTFGQVIAKKVYSVLSLNSLNLICMHRCILEIQGKKLQLRSRECVLCPECSTSIILDYHEMPWILLVPMTRLICILAYVWRPSLNVIFDVLLQQTKRIFLPCKFAAECTSERIFTIIEVSVFQNQNCDLVCHFPGPAFSSFWSFLVRHFQVLQI